MSNIEVGTPDVEPDKPAHTPKVPTGNDPGNYDKQPGHLPDGRSTSRRSTGIRPKSRNPILPSMPNLSPA